MTEFSVYLPREISISAEQTVTEAGIPLLPADKIATGILHPDRIPTLPISKVVGLSSDSVTEHLEALDPHPQYAKDTDLMVLYEQIEAIQAILTSNDLML